MRIVIINPKKDFTEEQIKQLQRAGTLIFLETLQEYKDKQQELFSTEETVIAPGPEVLEWNLPNDVLDSFVGLKGVCLPTTGYTWVDGAHLREKNIPLTNSPGYSRESVAEYAISLMLNLSKNLPLVIRNNWKIDYDTQLGWEIQGKTMGILGLGSIGSRIAELGKSMGMKVIYWSKNSRNAQYEYEEFDEVLKNSDYIFPAMAGNDDTEGILNSQKLDLIKKGAFFINVASSKAFDKEYVVKMANEGRLSGLAFESEDQNFTDFIGNIFVTPPIAWFTREALAANMKLWTETIISVAQGKPEHVVN